MHKNNQLLNGRLQIKKNYLTFTHNKNFEHIINKMMENSGPLKNDVCLQRNGPLYKRNLITSIVYK